MYIASNHPGNPIKHMLFSSLSLRAGCMVNKRDIQRVAILTAQVISVSGGYTVTESANDFSKESVFVTM